MIVGGFDRHGRPYVEVRVTIPRLQVDEKVLFLLDTGADSTCIHPQDTESLGIPISELRNPVSSMGVCGTSAYYREPALLGFSDGPDDRFYVVALLVAEPNEISANLPSLLGRNIINHWSVDYDPTNARLECAVRHADYTLNA